MTFSFKAQEEKMIKTLPFNVTLNIKHVTLNSLQGKLPVVFKETFQGYFSI